MNDQTKDDVKAISKLAFPEYTGRKFRLVDTKTVFVHDLNWGGGSRNYYVAVRLIDGVTQKAFERAPWDQPCEGTTVNIPDGIAIVEHSFFCGKDMGCRVHVNLGAKVTFNEPKKLGD